MRSDKYKLRVKAVREFLNGESQKSICRRYQITRQTLYLWLKKYQKNPSAPQILLNDHYIRGRKHPKSIPFSLEKAVLDLVVSQPLLNHRQIALRLNEAKPRISASGVYSILVRYNLHAAQLRQEFSREHPAGTAITAKLAPAYRAKAVSEHLDDGKPVSHICKKWLVSRPTFYKWLTRYQEALKEAVGKPYEPKVIEALVKRYRRGHEHQNSIGSEVREVILNMVKSSPSLSVHRIYAQVPRVANKPIASHAAIQNLLTREGLNKVTARFDFAKAHAVDIDVKTAPLYIPQIPLYKLRHLIAHFATVPRLVFSSPTKGLPIKALVFSSLVIFILWIRLLITTPNSSPAGLFFASTALLFGLFFFIYSMKYYISTLMVLRLAQSGSSFAKATEDKAGQGESQRQKSKLGEFLSRMGLRLPQRQGVNPLNINLEKVELNPGERPFVSIHVAMYNEKRVVERLIRACEAQEWGEDAGPVSRFPPVSARSDLNSNIGQQDNPDLRVDGSPSSAATRRGMAKYEVVIADDSTDETYEIAKGLLSSEGRILDRILNNSEMEIYVSSPPVGSSLPVIKLIHRFSRSGFKGGALQKALENTNPKAAYITIFDADFVPYPDTIEQFIKTFQVLGRSTKSTTSITSTTSNEKAFDTSDTFGTSDTSNIAAVQGYQWHVLNKSQNWVTRGVRTEYAGSYVVERAGEEIYGGLKQIAGSVYMIRAEILRQFGWGKSITEDFELTLRLYERGYKVAFTPYIQAPAEAVSTLKRLIRQRMRWAEGASFNIKVMLGRMLWGRWEEGDNYKLQSTNYKLEMSNEVRPDTGSRKEESGHDPVSLGKVWVKSRLTRAEKLEFAYLAPYYLQAAFFVIGTFSWFISETIIGTRLPFWTAALGWSLVFTNLLALPLMNIVGMFLEESDERDYIGILSFIALSYIVVPFQAYAAIKGFLETEEGPWFRTPKTGLITDTLGRSGFSKFFGNILGRPAAAPVMHSGALFTPGVGQGAALHTPGVLPAIAWAFNPLQGRRFAVKPRYIRHMGNLALGTVIALTVLMSMFAPFVPAATSYASQTQLKTVEAATKGTDDPGSSLPDPGSGGLDNDPVSLSSAYSSADTGSEEQKAGFDPKEPANKEEILRNVMTEEITKSRAIKKTTKGGMSVEFMFEKEPNVRIKLRNSASADSFGETREIEFETKTIFGQKVNPQKAKIYGDKEVIYEEVIPGVDLKYSLTNDLLVEEVILKDNPFDDTGSLKFSDPVSLTVEQSIRTVDVKVVSPDPGSFGFYPEDCGKQAKGSDPLEEDPLGEGDLGSDPKQDCRELFQLSQPFAKDAKGEVNNDLTFSLHKEFDGHTLVKSLGDSAKTWLADPNRAYPVSIDPTVIVSGGIAETETTYGGLQRKVAFVNGNWYAFYGTSANDCVTTCSINYKKSSDGVTWGSAVDMDSTDTDNYNPSISVSGNIIFVFWIDSGTANTEGRTFDTGNSDLQDTLCTSATAFSADASYMVTVAAYSTTQAVVASSDTDAGSTISLLDFTDLVGACSGIVNISTGNITFGSGLTAGDRPVIVYGANLVAAADQTNLDGVAMIFQDGDLSYSLYNDPGNVNGGKWISNNLTIASVTDNVYSVTTNGTTVWILSVSGTTAANFYSCCSADISETQVDADAGTTNDDGDSDINMFCPAENNCKIVYTDDIDTTSPALKFVDCNDSTCSAPTITTLIADLGDATDQAGASIFCVDDGDTVVSDNCKVVTADLLGGNSTDVSFIDCTNDENCSTNTITDVDADIATGTDTVMFHSSIYCPTDGNCKFVYNDELSTGDSVPDVNFVDCPDATCTSTGRVITTLDTDYGVGNEATPTAPWMDLYCVASDDCKIVYHDNDATGGCADANSLCFVDCTADEDCSTNTQTPIDSDIGTTQGASPVSVDCVGGTTECTIVYGDGTDGDLTFVDCEGSATCASGSTITDIDTTGGSNGETFVKVSVYCVTNSDCKIFYSDRTNGDGALFADCDNETCTTGSIFDFPGPPRWGGALVCLTSANCKFAYYKGTDSTAPTVQFADCDVTNCFPSATDASDPWTGQTAVETVSLTYDSTNSDLYAHIIMDTTDQAYWKSSDATTIAWGSQSSYSFTAGTLNQISAPQSGAGTSQIGVVLNQGSNFEFSAVPERTIYLLLTTPLVYGWLEKRRRKESLHAKRISELISLAIPYRERNLKWR